MDRISRTVVGFRGMGTVVVCGTLTRGIVTVVMFADPLSGAVARWCSVRGCTHTHATNEHRCVSPGFGDAFRP